MNTNPGKYLAKPGKAIAPRGFCPSCGTTARVSNKEWYHASRPRCPACGDFLAPGTAHKAAHYDLPDRGLKAAFNREHYAAIRQMPESVRKRQHNCFIKGCPAKTMTKFALCFHHSTALRALDRRLYLRIQGRYIAFHNARWKVYPKALSLWNILIASASNKLSKMTEPSSPETLTP